jgi:CBS domain-containing protein
MQTIEQILMVKGPDVIVAGSDTTVLAAAREMSQANVGSIVIQDGELLKGIFTERDILHRVVAKGKDPATTLLSEVMSSPIKSCRLADTIERVAETLRSGHIRHLAVIEDDALVGMVGMRDVMAAQIRDAHVQIRDLEDRIEQTD